MSEPLWLPMKARPAVFPAPEEGKYLKAESGQPVWRDPGLVTPDAAFRVFGTAGQPQYKNGWADYSDPNYAPARFRKLADGMVVLEGMMRGGTASAVALELPLNYRPADVLTAYGRAMHNRGPSNAAQTTMYVYSDGRLVPAAAYTYVGLDNWHFYAPEVIPVTSPADLTGLKVWLDASQLALADGAAVSPWAGSGGAIGGIVGGTPAPICRAGANGLNGLRVVRFTAGQGRITAAASTGITTAYTAFIVARMWGTTKARLLSHPSQNYLVGWHGGREDVFFANPWSVPDVTITAGTAWKIHTVSCATNAPRFHASGCWISAVTAATTHWANDFQLNGYNGTSEMSDCEVAEFIQYNRELTMAERARVELYLQTKWAIPVR